MSMDAAREDRLERLYERALALPAERREEFVRHACADDAELRPALITLLAHAADAESFFDRVAGPSVAGVAGRLFGADFGETDLSDDARVGRRVAHFQILGRLGRGGMGCVYEATDLLLHRRVALKFLPRHLGGDAAAKERFVHEARTASALNHPAICAVHEIGETDEGELFIAMAHCDGVTLERRIAGGPVPVAEALGYAAQIAEGLQRAHAAAIVHRDIKPANVMVMNGGRVQIVDFGVATMAGADLTRDGATVGTVAYMSPEQTRGAALDACTDIWSLGVLLYELLAGRRPFAGEIHDSLIDRIRHADPPPLRHSVPGLPRGVETLVNRCLEKEPERRYRGAGELLADLRTLQEGGTVRRPLDRRRGVRVGAAALAASLVLVGGSWFALRPMGVASVAVLPVRAPLGDSVPRRFADAMVAAPAVHPEAFALYLKGARTADLREQALLLEKAVATDSTFALANARLALSYIMVARDEVKAEQAIERALALDPRSSEGFDALGLLRMWLQQDWTGAESAFRRAIALNPHNGQAHHELGQLLMRLGRCDEAIAEEERAVLQNPGVAHFQSGLAEIYLYCRRYEQAILNLERNLPLVSDSSRTYVLLGDVYFHKGEYARALATHRKSSAPDPGWIHVALGDEGPARVQVAELTARWRRGESDAFTAWHLARLHTSLGEPDVAITWLERSHAEGYGLIAYLKVHPHFDALRALPRFQALLQKVALAG